MNFYLNYCLLLNPEKDTSIFGHQMSTEEILAEVKKADKDKCRQVIQWLGKTKLPSHHAPVIAQTLRSLVEVQNKSKPLTLTLLSEMNDIAMTLWRSLRHSKLPEESHDWLREAFNHPAGVLTEFWLSSLSLYQKQQDPPPKTLNDEYRTILLTIIQESSPMGILGRSVLASQFCTLLNIDEKWTKDTLLPSLIKGKDIDEKWMKDILLSSFASNIGHHLSNLNEGQQQEWWKRWLKKYWKRRLYNIYAILEAKEIEIMLEWWLPYLDSVFPEAVELAIKMPLASEQRFTQHEAELGKLLENHPEPLAKLLIYLGKWENLDPEITWYETKELIDKLIKNDIPRSLKKELKELIVKLHLE